MAIKNTDILPHDTTFISLNLTMAVYVLDYYHACEHLHEFVQLAFKDAGTGKVWAEKQKDKLLQSKTAEVIWAIETIECLSKQAQDARLNLLNYYQSNLLRMD